MIAPVEKVHFDFPGYLPTDCGVRATSCLMEVLSAFMVISEG